MFLNFMLAMGVYAFNPNCQRQRQEDFYKFEVSQGYIIEQLGKLFFSRILSTLNIEEVILKKSLRSVNYSTVISILLYGGIRPGNMKHLFLKMPNEHCFN